MFEGDGFGVGLTVRQLHGPGLSRDEGLCQPGRRPARLGEVMPVAARGPEGLAVELRRANAADAQLWAYRVELVTQLAVHRRADLDRRPGTPGAAVPGWAETSWVLEGCSEFLPDEVALILNVSRGEASRFLATALTLSHRLPDTWAALADGQLSWSRARAIAEEVLRHGPDVDPHTVATVEAVVLPEAAELSVGRLRARVRAEFVRYDNDAADKRRAQAMRAADVFLRRSGLAGMAEVVTRLPAEAAAIADAVDQHARQAKADGDVRPIGLIRAEVAANLMLRPWDDSRPAVTAQLRVVAPINSLLPDPATPGCGGRPLGVAEVDGEPVSAAHLRALLTALDAICPGGLQAPPGGSLHLDLLGGGGNLLATLTRPELEQAARRGCPQHPAGDCRCPVVGKPPPPRRTSRPRRSAAGPPPATAPAGIPAAPAAPAGPTWTTSSRTPRAEPPTATTCAACAAATTGSRPTPPAGCSPSTPTATCWSPHPAASPGSADHQAATCSNPTSSAEHSPTTSSSTSRRTELRVRAGRPADPRRAEVTSPARVGG